MIRVFSACVALAVGLDAHGQCEREWNGTGLLAGVRGAATSMCSHDVGAGQQLFVGGALSAAGGTATSGIAMWDGEDWHALGEGLRWNIQIGAASSLTGFGSWVVAGGRFDWADGQPVRNVAAWSGTEWFTLGDGVVNPVNDLREYAGQLYATTIASANYDDETAPGIWVWNGSAWQDAAPPGTLDSSSVLGATAMVEFEGKLVVAFRYNDELFFQRVAMWDGSSWSELPVIADISIGSLAVFNGELVCGGAKVGETTSLNVRRWTGTSWQPIPGVSIPAHDPAPVGSICVEDGMLWIAGDFPWSASARLDLWGWNGSQWFIRPIVTGRIFCMQEHAGTLHIGGNVIGSGNEGFEGVAAWNDGWEALGTGTNGHVRAITEYRGDLVVGGAFELLNGAQIRRIARWTGATWEQLGNGLSGHVNGLVEYQGQLIALGSFPFSSGGVASPNIASWNGTVWQGCGRGVQAGGGHYALTGEVFQGDLVVCGDFTYVNNGLPVRDIARWNGTAWSGIHTTNHGEVIVDNRVRDIGVFEGDLIVGGLFRVPTRAIGRYDGTTWQPMNPSQPHYEVEAVAVHQGQLYIAGSLAAIGGPRLAGIARWNGAAWEPVGNGIGTSPLVVRMVSTPHGLVVTGQNLRLNASDEDEGMLRQTVMWDGEEWLDIVGSTDDSPLIFGVYGNAGSLYIGGTFDQIGEVRATGFAEWAIPLDVDRSGAIGMGDLFAFLSAFFSGLPSSDWDADGEVASADVFSFLQAWFPGCH